jgi:HK97 family phage portal protein
MGLVSRLRAAGSVLVAKDAAAGAPSANQGGGGFLPTLGATPSATGLLISQGTAMSVAAVYACVTIRAQDVARCKPRLYYEKPKSGTREQVTEHDLVELFKKPNRQQDWFEFIEQMMVAYLLRGGGYAAIKRNSKRKIVNELIPINPDAVLVLESWNGEIFYNVNRLGLWQIAMLREFPPAIASEDMFYLRGLTFNALVALSTIGVARDAVGVAMGLEQQTARWMKNGSRPSVVLQSKKALTKAAADRLKQAWDTFKSGIENTGNTVVLEDGLEAKELQLTSVDLEFMAQRNFSVTDITRFFRVPPFKIGATEIRGIDIEEINNDYVSGTIMPDLTRLEEKFGDTFDLPAQNLMVSFDERALLRSATKTRFANNRIGLGGASFLTINEVRAGEGLPSIGPAGDVLYQPSNIAAVGSDKTGGAPDGAGRPEAGTLPGPSIAPAKPLAADEEGEGEKTAATEMRFTMPPVDPKSLNGSASQEAA